MPDLPAVPRTATLGGSVADAFANKGALARAIPAFEARESQREMAAAVASVFERGGVLLAEAGTGTGKTLAYLTPAILSRHRVLISTGTKNLQEQIYFKDLPALLDSLGVPFTATYMKGRGNYLCLHRFESFRDASGGADRRDPPAGSARHVFLPIIERWAASTETGDRAEVADLPEDLPLWNEIAASSETCLGTECPRFSECFVTRMRQRAAASDLVIVNHHLLCADAALRESAFGEVIPACHYAVIDEAHQLEEVATQYFGISVSNYRFEELARDAERLAGAPLLAAERQDFRRAVDRFRDRATLFFSAVSLHCRVDGGIAAGQDHRMRLGPDSLSEVSEEAGTLLGSLETLEATIHLMKAPAPGGSDSTTGIEDLLAIASRAADLRADARFVMQAADPDFVYYVERRGHGLFLRASPIDVSAKIRELLLDRMQATVLTSATLAVDGSFEYVRSRLGVTSAAEVRLPSEFDFGRQALLYLPRRMPDPRSPEFPAAAGRQIVEILKRTAGRAFVLFTSYAVLRSVQLTAEAELDYPILVQGRAPRSVLLQQFRSTPNAVLLATSSFWQGVDVIGDALSCVIVDKLPFASPAEPVTAARIEAIAQRGGEPFSEYQVPLAILALQQGLGRLIRHRRDRGVLSVLDPRLRTRGYGRRFLDSIPQAPVTTDLRDIERFFDERRAAR